MVQSAADSHTWDKYSTDTHSPCGTVRNGLSHMGRVQHRNTQPMWYSPQRTLTHGTSTVQTHTAHVVQPMWYSPQRTLTHGTRTVQTHSPCGTVRSGLSRMGQVQYRHTQPMWYSQQRTLTHGISTVQTHTAHVVQSAADSHAWDKYSTDTHAQVVQSAADSHSWDKYSTDTHSPCGTVRSGLSLMG